MPDLQTCFSGEPRRTRSRAVGALRRPQRRQAKRDDGHQFGAGGAAPAAASRADEGAGSQARGGRLKGSANPFDQEPGNSGPNPQGHSEHEGRGNNVCHASFLLVPSGRIRVSAQRRPSTHWFELEWTMPGTGTSVIAFILIVFGIVTVLAGVGLIIVAALTAFHVYKQGPRTSGTDYAAGVDWAKIPRAV